MTTLQNILSLSALVISLVFLFKKFFLKNKKTGKNCGNNCGCD
jgi:hypothetical protein